MAIVAGYTPQWLPTAFVALEGAVKAMEGRVRAMEGSTKNFSEWVTKANQSLEWIVNDRLGSLDQQQARFEERMRHGQDAVAMLVRDLKNMASINNRLENRMEEMEKLTNRMEEMEKLTNDTVKSVQWVVDRITIVEQRVETAERSCDEDNANRWYWLERLENRVEKVEKMMHQIDQELQRNYQELWQLGSFKIQAASDLASAKDQLASLANRLGAIEQLKRETMETMPLQDRIEQIASWTQQCRLAFQSRIEEVEKFTKEASQLTQEQIAFVLQGLQTAKEQATSDFVSAGDSLARFKTRTESMETLMQAQLKESIEKLTQLTEKHMGASEIAMEQMAREVAWAAVCENDRQASIEKRVEAIEQRQTATEEATIEQRQTATDEAARDAEYGLLDYPTL